MTKRRLHGNGVMGKCLGRIFEAVISNGADHGIGIPPALGINSFALRFLMICCSNFLQDQEITHDIAIVRIPT